MDQPNTPSPSSNDRVLIAFGCIALLILAILALRPRHDSSPAEGHPSMPAMETHRGEPSPTHQAQAPGPMPTPSNAATPTDPPLDIAALMSQGEELYHACIMCHGMNGDGLAGQFPPLKGAPFVIGPESRLTRILLQGLQGPVVVNGTTYEMPMAPAPLNEDQEFAAIMTYIRRSFGNNASAVSPATVTRIRAETKDKDSSWTVEELEQVP